MGATRTTHTGVSNHASNIPLGLKKETIMIEPGVYKTRSPALVVQYHGYNPDGKCEHPLKVKLTVPDKWIDQPTPVSRSRPSS